MWTKIRVSNTPWCIFLIKSFIVTLVNSFLLHSLNNQEATLWKRSILGNIVFISPTMNRHNLISAFMTFLLLVGAVLANDQEVDEEKDIEVRNAWTSTSSKFQLYINYSVASVMGSAAMAPTCLTRTLGSLPTTLTASTSAWPTVTPIILWQSVDSLHTTTLAQITATYSPTVPHLMDLV